MQIPCRTGLPSDAFMSSLQFAQWAAMAAAAARSRAMCKAQTQKAEWLRGCLTSTRWQLSARQWARLCVDHLLDDARRTWAGEQTKNKLVDCETCMRALARRLSVCVFTHSQAHQVSLPCQNEFRACSVAITSSWTPASTCRQQRKGDRKLYIWPLAAEVGLAPAWARQARPARLVTMFPPHSA